MMRVCIVSGGRADFGYLLEPMRALHADPRFELSIVLSGQHISAGAPERGSVLACAGLAKPEFVDIGLSKIGDGHAVTKACARALDGFADAFQRQRPDLLLVLGDRYEILCAALAATLVRIPIAHLAGGDVTAGAIDDAFRHSITAMAHLHFPTNADSARRLRQLGASSQRIHAIGSTGLDLVLKTEVKNRAELYAAVGLSDSRPGILVTFHPVTRATDSISQCRNLLDALADQGEDARIVITGANADPEGSSIDSELRAFASHRSNVVHIPSMGSLNYFSALTHFDVVVGNSSSGLYEAPSFGIPTVNIGDRQRGRLRAASVLDCAPERAAIVGAIKRGLAQGRRAVQNPYGDGQATPRLLAVLGSIADPRLLTKEFKDLAI